MIKNIIFDFGNIIVKFDYKLANYMNKYSDEVRQFLIDNVIYSEEWERKGLIDLGTVTLEEAANRINERTNNIYKDEVYEFLTTFSYNLEINGDILNLLKRLKNDGYKLYVLSNTNDGTWSVFKDRLEPLFDGLVLSYKIHEIKPNKAIYDYLLDTYKLNPEECLFIDDREANIKAANELGIKGRTINKDDYDDIVKVLHEYNILKDNYECKIASLEEVSAMMDFYIENDPDDRENWIKWKENAIDNIKNNRTINYHGLLNGKVICEATAAINGKLIQNSEDLINEETVYLLAFRTMPDYRDKGYFSKLFKFMINDLKEKGYKYATIGVEPDELRNKEIYKHYGFTEHIKTKEETNPDGSTIIVEYYRKEL